MKTISYRMLEIMCHSEVRFTFVNNIKYSLTTLLGFFSYYFNHKLHLLMLQPCFWVIFWHAPRESLLLFVDFLRRSHLLFWNFDTYVADAHTYTSSLGPAKLHPCKHCSLISCCILQSSFLSYNATHFSVLNYNLTSCFTLQPNFLFYTT